MEYTSQKFDTIVEQFGEVFFVLDSGVEYQVHGKDSYELEDSVVKVEGMKNGEYLKVRFPLDTIEHHYTHKEI